MKNRLFVSLASLVALPLLPTLAEPLDPGEVVFGEYGSVEQSLTGKAGDAKEGADVYANKKRGNCVACHVNSASDAPFQGTVGPPLDGAGDRWSESEMRGIVADAKKTFEDSVMPSFYKSDGYIRPGDGFTGKKGTPPLPPLLNAQDIEDVVAYLLTLKE